MPDYTNPYLIQMLRGQQQMAQQGAEGFDTAMKGKQDLEKLKLADLLGRGKTKEDLATAIQATQSGNLPEGASLRVGDVSLGTDPSIKNMAKGVQLTGSEGKALNTSWDKMQHKYEPVLDRLDQAAAGLKRNDALGLKQAAVGLAGVTEGQGQRILQSVVQSFGGDPTIIGSSEKLENFVSGLQNSGKSEAFKKSMAQALKHSYDSVQQGYQADKSEFLRRAPTLAPYSAQQPGFGDSLKNYGSGVEDKFGRVGTQFKDLEAAQSAQQQAVQQSPGIMDKLKSFFNRMPSQPAQPSMAPQQAPAQGIDPLDAEIAKRGLKLGQ